MNQGSFPHFSDGDVRITVFPDIYYLHSGVIKECSGVLRKLLESANCVTETEWQSIEPRVYLNINLTGSATHKYGVFESQGYASSHSTTEAMVSCSFPVWPQKTRQHWANILRIFYKLCPVLDSGGSDKILQNCLDLAEIGEVILAVDVVFRALDSTLPSFNQRLYHCITDDPISWIKLAMRIRSVPIFQESAIHLVGKWGLLEEKDHASIPTSVRNLCSAKHQELCLAKKAVEQRIASHYPRLFYSASETNSSYMWMAMAIWRQWLCQSFAENKNYPAPDGGAAFYRAIGAGGRAYLDTLDWESLGIPFPGSQEECEELGARLEDVKEDAKAFVSDLLINRAKYDPKTQGELPYLTCCKVDDSVLPWELPTSETNIETLETREVMQSNVTNNLQDHSHDTVIDPHLPSDMFGVYAATNGFLTSPRMQSSSNYGIANTSSQPDYMTWDYLNMDVITAHTPGQQNSQFYHLEDTFWLPQTNHGNHYNIGSASGVLPIIELDDNLQHDGSVAFL